VLLGAGAAQAGAIGPDVITDNGNVLRIENLLVFDESGTPTLYDVDFVSHSAVFVYGEFLDYDFTVEGNAALARQAIEDALNDEASIPVGAGPLGTDQFFIGFDEENDLVVALGSEFFPAGPGWDACDAGCATAGIRAMRRLATFTYADFTEAQIPEPGTALLLGLGVGSLGIVRRSRRYGSMESST
jgi:hypothetical protein